MPFYRIKNLKISFCFSFCKMELNEIEKNFSYDYDGTRHKTTAIIGSGWVGMLTGGMLAHKNRARDYVFIDTNKERLLKIINNEEIIQEESFYSYFKPLLKLNGKNKHGNIIGFTTNYEILKYCDIVYISVNTPDKHGSCDLSYLYSTIDGINKYVSVGASVIIKSTVEVGITKFLEESRFRRDLHIFNIPEFLAEGEAVHNLLHPRRTVIGITDKNKDGFYDAKNRIIFELFPDVETFNNMIITDSNTSELIKLSANFMLAQRVSSINAIESLAKDKRANIKDISLALGLDDRIGNKFLSPSAGFGGSCFKKDDNNISNICQDPIYKQYFKSVNDVNSHHMKQIAELIGTDKNILFLGYGFKENTNDPRESPTQFIIDNLDKSIKYTIYDIHFEDYKEQPKNIEQYDLILLMLNEEPYKVIAKNVDKNKLINPRYIDL